GGLGVGGGAVFSNATILCLARLRAPRVFERDRAVIDELVRHRVLIDAKVADSLELELASRPCRREARFDSAILHELERARVQKHFPVGVLVRKWVFDAKEPIVKPDVGSERVEGRDPVQRPLDFAAIGGVAASRVRIPRAAKLDDLASVVLHDLGAPDDARVPETHLLTGCEAKPFFW